MQQIATQPGKKQEILPFVSAWMDPEGIALSEMSDQERQMPYNLSYMRNTYNQSHKCK